MRFSGSVALVLGRALLWVALGGFGWLWVAFEDFGGLWSIPPTSAVQSDSKSLCSRHTRATVGARGESGKKVLLTMMTTMMGMGHQGDNDNTRGTNSWDSTHRWLHQDKKMRS
jgi:hypothetical protein